MNDIELINYLTGLDIKNSELTVNTIEIIFKAYYGDDDYVQDTWLKEIMETTKRNFYISVYSNVLRYIFTRTDKNK